MLGVLNRRSLIKISKSEISAVTLEVLPSERMRQTISEEILTGRLSPGTSLSESGLAERFGVSRTPVREAVRLLAGDGLVQLRPGRKPIVRGQTVAEMLDQFEAMSELEASCASLAAQRRHPSCLERMKSAQKNCRQHAKTNDVDLYYEANVRFHEAIYDMSENSYLKTETLRLRDRLHFLRISQGRLPGRLAQSADEHDRILTAICEGDDVTAAIEMRKHVMVQGERLRVMLRNTDPGGIVSLAEVPPKEETKPNSRRRKPGD